MPVLTLDSGGAERDCIMFSRTRRAYAGASAGVSRGWEQSRMHANLEPDPARASRGPAIPVYGPSLGEEEAANLSECVRSHQLIHGPFAARFKQSTPAYVGHDQGVGTNSGTAALHVA